MGRGGFLCLVMFALSVAPGAGQASPLRLTMEDTVDRALAASRDLRVSRKTVDIARVNLDRSRAWLPANPYVSVGAQDVVHNQFGPNYGATLSQEFEIAGQRGKRVAVAEKGVVRAEWELRAAELTLVTNVKQSFIHALLGPERVALAQEGLEAAQQLSHDLSERKPSSDAARMDLNIALVQESRARRDLAEAKRAAADSLGLLRYYLGLPSTQPLDLMGAAQTQVSDLPPREELLKRALEQRPDLVALRHSAEQLALQVEVTQRQRVPNIMLSGSVSRFEGDTFAGGDVGFSLPVVQTGRPETLEAIAERDQTKAQLEDLERTVDWDIAQARRACEVAAVSLEAAQREIVPRNEQNLALQRGRFRRGQIGVADLIGVQIDALYARREYYDAVQQYNDALIDLHRATGEILDGIPSSLEKP